MTNTTRPLTIRDIMIYMDTQRQYLPKGHYLFVQPVEITEAGWFADFQNFLNTIQHPSQAVALGRRNKKVADWTHREG